MHRIELLGPGLAEVQHLHGLDFEAGFLEAAQDLADEAAGDAVGFEHG